MPSVASQTAAMLPRRASPRKSVLARLPDRREPTRRGLHRMVTAFRSRLIDLWRRSLKRRSQKDRTTWRRITELVDDFLPRGRILHPWPEERFGVKHPRWELSAQIGHARFCAGGAIIEIANDKSGDYADCKSVSSTPAAATARTPAARRSSRTLGVRTLVPAFLAVVDHARKCASKSRPSDEWNEDDDDALADCDASTHHEGRDADMAVQR